MGKNTRRELSLVEKGTVISLCWFFRKIFIVSLITGRPWSTVKNILQQAAGRGNVGNLPRCGDPKNPPNAGYLSNDESRKLTESNYVTSVHLVCH